MPSSGHVEINAVGADIGEAAEAVESPPYRLRAYRR